MPVSRENWKGLAALLGALAALAPLSTDAVVPGLPDTARAFGTNITQVQLVLSAFMLGLALSQLIWGPLGDRFGRRRPIMAGMVLFLGATALCLWAPSFSALLAGRFLQALGAASPMVLSKAVTRDWYEGERAVAIFSLITATLFLGPSLGPVLGGYLTSWFGWSGMYGFLLAWGTLGTLLVVFLLPETLPPHSAQKPPGPLGSFRPVFAKRRFRVCTAVASLASFGLFGFVAGSSQILMAEMGLSTRAFGYAYMVVAVGYILGTRLSPRLAVRPTGHRLLLGLAPGAVAGAALVALAAVGPDSGASAVAAVVGCTFLFYVSLGLAQPVAMAGALQPFTHLSGAAASWMGFVQMLCAALATVVVGRLHSETEIGVGAVFLVTSGLGMLLARTLRDP